MKIIIRATKEERDITLSGPKRIKQAIESLLEGSPFYDTEIVIEIEK